MNVAYTAQRSENDCGIAVLAMACGVAYEHVAADLGGTAVADGIDDVCLKDFLFRGRFVWQEITAYYPKAGRYQARRPWPPRPWAPVHIALVQATRGLHYAVMDQTGAVLDPWSEARKTLTHPDYKRVLAVIGLWRLGDRVAG